MISHALLARLHICCFFTPNDMLTHLRTPQGMTPDQHASWMQVPYNAQYQDAKLDLRKCASELFSTTTAVRAYGFWVLLGLAPQRRRVEESINLLIGVSNALFVGANSSFQDRDGKDNGESADRIRVLLRLNRLQVR